MNQLSDKTQQENNNLFVTNKTVYQTLEDRDNVDAIEQHGPYLCDNSNAWLGVGYYFWDTFILNAHWWGKEGAKYANGYIICKAECNFNTSDCFDLVGEPEHIQQFIQTIQLMKKQGLCKDDTTVARVINYLKNDLKLFKFKAIRAYGVNSKANTSNYNHRLFFNPLKPQYLDLYPAIQICFFQNNSMNLTNYIVVYPVEYADGYAT